MKLLPVNRQTNRTIQRNRVLTPRLGLEVGMLSLTVALAMVPVGVRGADVVWDNGSADNLWVTPSNWDGDAVPTAADNISLPVTGGGSIWMPAGAVGNGMNVDGSYFMVGGNLSLADRLWVAPSAGGMLNLASSTSLTAPSVTVGVDAASAGGALSVYPGSSLSVSGNLGIGYAGTGHSLSVNGTATALSFTVGGNTPGIKNNSFTVGGPGSLSSSGTMIIGYNDSSNSGQVFGSLGTGAAYLGTFAGSNGNSLSVGGTWTATDSVVVGLGGSANHVYTAGTITMSGAGKDFVVGHDANADANYAIVNSGGSLSINGGLYAGKGGDQNRVWIGDFNTPGSIGTVTSTVGRIGSDAGSDANTVTVANAGSSWTLTGALRVGGSGSNNDLQILNGGVVSVTGNKNVWVGYADNSGGNRIIVDGVGSTLDVQGTGEITLSNGGLPDPSTGYNIIEVTNGGHVNAAKVNLGPTGAIILGQDNVASPMGTIDPDTVITGFGNPNASLFDPSGGASVVAVINLAGTGTYTLPNVIGGTATFLQQGSGIVELTGANTYTGPTLVFGGTLQLSGASNNIASSSEIVTVPGASFDVSGVTGGFSLGSTQSLKGFGTVVGNITAPSGSTIQGGAEYLGGPGQLTFTDNVTMQGGSNLNVSILAGNPVETNQTNAGTLWSMVQITGTLSLTGLDAVPVAINLENGSAIPYGTSTWEILAADGGIDFNGTAITTYTDYTSYFDVKTLASNGMAGWNGILTDIKVVSLGDSNTLYLRATSVPEPGQTMAVLVVGGFLGGRVLRRRRIV